jgi:hypothetical protein
LFKEDDALKSFDEEELKNETERFRKAGYGQPLQKKYRSIIDLILKESFLSVSAYRASDKGESG